MVLEICRCGEGTEGVKGELFVLLHNISSPPGLAYEIALSIRENRIVWTNGPFPASWHDITIYRRDLMNLVPIGGLMDIGDSGYSGEPDSLTIIRSNDSATLKKFKEAAQARQENIYERIKEFSLINMR
jgi:hypothetical protein